ncbi:hypothetical protein [Grimontia sp. SpTr1]|uniref:hypothetical protein n=1 Tax=Grimontia sp. SpTr1 TaxID=2995319 RepID=UPI00248D213B|nr:hypothetical protein [Grimontia sp. SpTr1]
MKKLQNVIFHQHALELYDAVVINSKKAVQIRKNKANRGELLSEQRKSHAHFGAKTTQATALRFSASNTPSLSKTFGWNVPQSA